MATRCYIGYSEAGYEDDTMPDVRRSTTVWAVYCHHDGGPNFVGKNLVDHYDDPLVIEDLIEHGNLSSLKPTIEASEFYIRDMRRPANDERARSFSSPDEYLRWIQRSGGIEHAYLHTHDAGWLHVDLRRGNAEWKPLPGSAPPQTMGEESLAYIKRLYTMRLQKLPNESDELRTEWLRAAIERNITNDRRRVVSLTRLVKASADPKKENEPPVNETELARLQKLAAIRKE